MLSLFYLSVGSAAQGCRSNGVTFVLLEEGIDGVLRRGLVLYYLWIRDYLQCTMLFL